jgi:predicted enzyme related to lactoylglutathione lyase
MSEHDQVKFGGMTPILRVNDLAASLDYYTNVLGFANDWGIVDGFASISRDHCHLFLSEYDQGHTGSWVYIGVDDVEKLFEQLKTRGAKIRHPPTNYNWAREMQVEDPSGNILRIGSDPTPGQPNGEWLDMEGRRWLHTARGWVEVKD